MTTRPDIDIAAAFTPAEQPAARSAGDARRKAEALDAARAYVGGSRTTTDLDDDPDGVQREARAAAYQPDPVRDRLVDAEREQPGTWRRMGLDAQARAALTMHGDFKDAHDAQQSTDPAGA